MPLEVEPDLLINDLDLGYLMYLCETSLLLCTATDNLVPKKLSYLVNFSRFKQFIDNIFCSVNMCIQIGSHNLTNVR